MCYWKHTFFGFCLVLFCFVLFLFLFLFCFVLFCFFWLPCRRSRRVLYLTRFFFLLSSSFFILATLLRLMTQQCLYRFQPDLVTRTPDPPNQSYNQLGVKGHVGVTGVKKGHFTKNATPATDYRLWSHDSCTCISLTPLQKLWV